jgi:hypothetical protein
MIIRKKQPSKRKKIALLIGIPLIAVALLITILEATNTTHLFHEKVATPGVIPSTSTKQVSEPSKDKGRAVPSSDSPATPATPGGAPKEGDTPAAPTAPSGAAPTAPYGNFVSNHSPNLSGTPAPSTIESVCNTTPGATCRLEFTNTAGVVKNLAPQTTDGTGATYWSWDVNKAGFTAGIWKIKAIAEKNGQATTSTSSQDLEVKS